MAINVGTVTIDSATGAVTAQTGAAGEAFAVLEAAADYGQFVGPNLAKARLGQATIAIAIATAAAHIAANAKVIVTPADTGLQTSTPSGSPTGPPAAPVTLDVS